MKKQEKQDGAAFLEWTFLFTCKPSLSLTMLLSTFLRTSSILWCFQFIGLWLQSSITELIHHQRTMTGVMTTILMGEFVALQHKYNFLFNQSYKYNTIVMQWNSVLCLKTCLYIMGAYHDHRPHCKGLYSILRSKSTAQLACLPITLYRYL